MTWVVLALAAAYFAWAWRKGHAQPVFRMVWFEVRHPILFARMVRASFRPKPPEGDTPTTVVA